MSSLLNKSIWLAVFCALAALMLQPAVQERHTATACWNTYLTECHDRAWNLFWTQQYPSGSGRMWRRFPTNPSPSVDTWGLQDVVYSTRLQTLCGNDIQANWMQGGQRQYDPDNDIYNAGKTIYMTYGPFSLAAATDAVIQFDLLCNSELHGDSIFWGVATGTTLNNGNIMIDSSFSGRTVEQMGQAWATIQMDLGDLHNVAGDSVSALGLSTVYAFWWWKSNNNTVPNNPVNFNGAFVDNVIIQWDDGFIDEIAQGITLLDENFDIIEGNIILYDSLRARFTWRTCAGGVDAYPDTRVLVTAEDPNEEVVTLLDTVVTDVVEDAFYTWTTRAWEVGISGDWNITVFVDPDNEVTESDEDNNLTSALVTVLEPNPPPVFTWLQPALDTLHTPTIAMLKWECYDPDETAQISLYADGNDEGCFGDVIPGGINLNEADGIDSLAWDVSGLIDFRIRYPFALVRDERSSICVYAPFPVQKVPLDATELPNAGIPDEFYLKQNYPNPFNPQTEIQYGVAREGLVTLTVFDLLGRQVAELVNESLSPGTYVSIFNGRDLPSGVYLYTLATPEGTMSQKMILMK